MAWYSIHDAHACIEIQLYVFANDNKNRPGNISSWFLAYDEYAKFSWMVNLQSALRHNSVLKS